MKEQRSVTAVRGGARASVLVACLLSGCATFINGTEQEVLITSDPPGATVLIEHYERLFGKFADPPRRITTPATVWFQRLDSYLLRAEKDTYESQTVWAHPRYSWWGVIDALWVIDPSLAVLLFGVNNGTGGWYAFNDIHITLTRRE